MKRFVCSGVVCGTTVLGALAIPLAVGQSPPGPGGAKVEAAKEQGRKDVVVGQAMWQWSTDFVALILVEPEGLALPKK